MHVASRSERRVRRRSRTNFGWHARREATQRRALQRFHQRNVKFVRVFLTSDAQMTRDLTHVVDQVQRANALARRIETGDNLFFEQTPHAVLEAAVGAVHRVETVLRERRYREETLQRRVQEASVVQVLKRAALCSSNQSQMACTCK